MNQYSISNIPSRPAGSRKAGEYPMSKGNSRVTGERGEKIQYPTEQPIFQYPISNKEYPISNGEQPGDWRQRLTAVSAVLSNKKMTKWKDEKTKVLTLKRDFSVSCG